MSGIKNYFVNKYKKRCHTTRVECSKFVKNIPLKKDESNLCDGEIDLQETLNALNTMENNKCPGNKKLEIMLEQCLNTCYKDKELTASQNRL